MPDWAIALGARFLQPSAFSVNAGPTRAAEPDGRIFLSAFTLTVPLTDTTIYLDYLKKRFLHHGGSIREGINFNRLDEVGHEFDLIVNCSGIGAKELVPDVTLEPHRGQVAIVSKLALPYAVVCDDPPLMYAIPRSNDCLFGGTNELSDNREVDAVVTKRIVAECSRVLNIDAPPVIAERVGLRPFRRSGICLRSDRLCDGRPVLHNYGHGGSGFTLSWGCAAEVLALAKQP
ncbi:MAG: D-amino-acid oxidase, partial [Verrucomicrobiota bacterium]|jgi:D-amino-acid oxidase